MKKILFSLYAMLITVSVAYGQEQQLPKDEVNQVKVENVYLSTTSETTDFPVFFYSDYKYGEENKSTHVSGVEFNIQLPTGVEFVTKQNGEPEYKVGTTFNITPTVNIVGGVLKVIMGSSDPIKSAHSMLIAFKIKKSTDLSNGVLTGGKIFNVIESKSGAYELNDFNFDITVTDRVVLDENSPFDVTTTGTKNVLVKRTLKSGKWSTLFLPFSVVDLTSLNTALGGTPKYAQFTGWESEDPTQNINISFTTISDYILAETPYLIYVTSDINEFTLDNVDFGAIDGFSKNPVKINNTAISTGSSPFIKYASGAMTGVSNLHAMGANELFLQDNTFYFSHEGQNIKGFRATFKFKDPSGNDYLIANGAGSRSMFVVDGKSIDDGATSISSKRYVSENKKVYSVTGRFMGENVDMKSLPKGIYIVDGVKIVNE